MADLTPEAASTGNGKGSRGSFGRFLRRLSWRGDIETPTEDANDSAKGTSDEWQKTEKPKPTAPVAKETKPEEPKRDIYGFIVNQKHFDRYMAYLQKNIPLQCKQNEKFQEFFVAHKLRDGVTKASFTEEHARGGIPPKYRGEVWKLFTNVPEQLAKNKGVYHKLLEDNKDKVSDHVWQIEKDVPRTFPNFKDENFIDTLRRVLTAYSWKNKKIGYCQSMNIVSGVLLVFMDEESAFWALDYLLTNILCDYYNPDMSGVLRDAEIMEELLYRYSPKLRAHCQENDLKLGIFTIPMLLTMHASKLPKETLFRIWDCILFRGAPVLFESMLELIMPHIDDICSLYDEAEIVGFLFEEMARNYDPDFTIQGKFVETPITIQEVEEARIKYEKLITLQLKTRVHEHYVLVDAHINTQFNWAAIKSLHKQFLFLAEQNMDVPRITETTFHGIIRHVLPEWQSEKFISKLFTVLDEDNDQLLGFQELIYGLNILCQGQVYQKIILTFKMFNVDNIGYVTKSRFFDMLSLIYEMYGLQDSREEIRVYVYMIFEMVGKKDMLSLGDFKEAVFIQPLIMKCFKLDCTQPIKNVTLCEAQGGKLFEDK